MDILQLLYEEQSLVYKQQSYLLQLKNTLITKPESDTDTAIIAEGLEEQEVSSREFQTHRRTV